MRRCLAVLATTAVLASCGGPVPTPSPVASTTPAPSADPAPIVDAFVATVGKAADGTTTNDLQIDAVAADGTRRSVATLKDLTTGLAAGSRILPPEAILVSPRGFLTVGVDLAVAGVEGDVERRLIFDLHDLGRRPLVVPSGPAAWGPDGRLAIVGGFETTFVDPTGKSIVVSNPEGVSISTVWAGDGSGLLASRRDANDRPVLGILLGNGHFVAGLRPSYSTMGVGRPYGATGIFIGDAVSEGADGADHVLVEERPGGERPRDWIAVHAPGPDPSILDHAWDAAGTGLWVLLGRDGMARLVHLAGPGASVERATFETTGESRIVGVAPNDVAVVVAMDATDAAPAALLRIDTSTGAIVRIERADGRSYFAGWAAAP